MCVRDNKTRCERWHEHNDNYAINADACTFGIAIVTLRHWYRVSRWRHFVGSRTHISISWTFCPPNISCHVMSKHPFIHLDLVLFFCFFPRFGPIIFVWCVDTYRKLRAAGFGMVYYTHAMQSESVDFVRWRAKVNDTVMLKGGLRCTHTLLIFVPPNPPHTPTHPHTHTHITIPTLANIENAKNQAMSDKKKNNDKLSAITVCCGECFLRAPYAGKLSLRTLQKMLPRTLYCYIVIQKKNETFSPLWTMNMWTPSVPYWFTIASHTFVNFA